MRGQGFTIFTPANLLRGAAYAGYISSFLAQRTSGPVVLVGHSYGGFAITNAATGGGDVKALVYVDAWTSIVRVIDPRFQFTDPPLRHSLPVVLTFAATAGRPAAVLTGPAVIAGSRPG